MKTGFLSQFLLYWIKIMLLNNLRGECIVFCIVKCKKSCKGCLYKVIEGSKDAMVIIDRNSIVLAFNDSAEKIFGIPKEKVVGQSLDRLFIDEKKMKHNKLVKDYFSGQESAVMGKTVLLQVERIDDRKMVDIELSLSSFCHEKSELVMAAIRDVSDREAIRRALLKEKERFETYIGLANVCFVALNKSGVVEYANEKAAKLLEGSLEEIVGKNWFECFVPVHEKEKVMKVSEALLRGDVEKHSIFENYVQTLKGSNKLCRWRNTFLKDDKGEIIGHLSAGDDVTQEREKDKKVREAQRLDSLGVLAGGIAHELNNFLTGAMGMVELLLSIEIPQEVRKRLERVNGSHKDIRELIRQILLYAKKTDEKIEPVLVNTIIMGVNSILDTTIPAYIENTVVFDGHVKRRVVMANKQSVQQVVINLINNAVDAVEMREQGSGEIFIKFSIEQDEVEDREMVKIAVRDNGYGIPVDVQKRMFDLFFTTKSDEQKRMKGGTGMGLSLVQKIVSDLGGYIKYKTWLLKEENEVEEEVAEESEEVEEDSEPEEEPKEEEKCGSLFEVFIPVATVDNIRRENVEKEKMGNGEYVVYIDDKEHVRKTAVLMIERLGYKAKGFASVMDFYDYFETNKIENIEKIDCLITDQAMPKMTGLQLLKQLKKKHCSFPILVTTGFSSEVNEENYQDFCADGFLPKPWTKKEIMNALHEVLYK